MPPARTAKKATAASNGKTPAKRTDLDALRAEVAAELPEGHDSAKPVPFCGTTVLVKDFWDWPASANEDLARGLIVRWASKVMSPDDFAVFVATEPTNRQAGQFIAAVEEVIGFPLGSWLTSLAS